MGDSFQLGRIAGIRIGINWSWLVVFALIVWTLAANVFPHHESRPVGDAPTWSWRSPRPSLFFASLLAARARARVWSQGARGWRSRASRSGCSAAWRSSRACSRPRARSSGSRSPGRSSRSLSGGLLRARRSACGLPAEVDAVARLARLHQPAPARLQPAARTAARRRAGAPLGALAGEARLRLGDAARRRASGAASASSSSGSASSSSSSGARSRASGSPSSAGSCSRPRAGRRATSPPARRSAACTCAT